MIDRLLRLRKYLSARKSDAFLICGEANRYYLSGFAGAGVLLVTEEKTHLVTDGRYREDAQRAAQAGCGEISIVCREQGEDLPVTVGKLCQETHLKRVLAEAEHLSVAAWKKYKTALGCGRLIPSQGVIEGMRLVKSREELAAIRRAAQISDAAFQTVLPMFQDGVREMEISLELERQMLLRGAAGTAFDFIVASGLRASLPHGGATTRPLAAGELVVCDFGAVWEGYHSDTTRTLVVGGKPSPRQTELFELVRLAQESALDVLRPGVPAEEVDAAARRVLNDAGLGDAFVHALGHGVGLEIHEEPRLRTTSRTIVEEGMVVTVEPGIYLPGWGGIRLEETVAVTAGGPDILTKAGKFLSI